MKRQAVLLLAAALVLLVSILSVQSALAQRDPFIGAWTSIDLADGSSQRLTIGGGPGGTYHFTYRDDGASLCGVDPANGAPLYAANATGTLVASGNTLSGDRLIYCLAKPHVFLENFPLNLTYDPVADTLSDPMDPYHVVWHR